MLYIAYSLLLYSTHPLAAFVMMYILGALLKDSYSNLKEQSSNFSSKALVSGPISMN